MKSTLAILLAVGILTVASCAQFSRTNRIYRPCSATTVQARVEVQLDGDIDLVPCSGRSVLINGVATSNTLTVSGSSRTSFFPYYSTETNLAKSPFSWSGTAYAWNNTALNSESVMEFTPGIANGDRFRVGDFTTTPTAYLEVVQGAAPNVHFQSGNNDFFTLSPTLLDATSDNIHLTSTSGQILLDSRASATAIGDVDESSSGTAFVVTDSTGSFSFVNSSNAAVMFLYGVNNFELQRTITAGGTTGNRTINAPAGTVNFAAGTGTAGITVTNSIATANSIVLATARTNDATCSVKNVVAGAGSFVITMTAACTAETSVGFLVLN